MLRHDRKPVFRTVECDVVIRIGQLLMGSVQGKNLDSWVMSTLTTAWPLILRDLAGVAPIKLLSQIFPTYFSDYCGVEVWRGGLGGA